MKDLYDKLKMFLATRQYHYRKVFNTPFGQEVLTDLARFCRANSSTFHENARVQANLDGRREVWLRILAHLDLDEREAYKMFTGRDYDVS